MHWNVSFHGCFFGYEPCHQHEGGKFIFLPLFCQVSHCFLPIPWLICCSHSLSMWKLGRAVGSRFQHCFMMLYTTSGQPSGLSILYPFSTRGTTSFKGWRKQKRIAKIQSYYIQHSSHRAMTQHKTIITSLKNPLLLNSKFTKVGQCLLYTLLSLPLQ